MLSKVFGHSRASKLGQAKCDASTRTLRSAAILGGEVFGPTPKGITREFLCLDSNTWLWHEQIEEGHGQVKTVTTKYEVHGSEVTKSQGQTIGLPISFEEARNLYLAIEEYERRMEGELASLVYAGSDHQTNL